MFGGYINNNYLESLKFIIIENTATYNLCQVTFCFHLAKFISKYSNQIFIVLSILAQKKLIRLIGSSLDEFYVSLIGGWYQINSSLISGKDLLQLGSLAWKVKINFHLHLLELEETTFLIQRYLDLFNNIQNQLY